MKDLFRRIWALIPKQALGMLAFCGLSTAHAWAASTTVGGQDLSGGVNAFILLCQVLMGMGVVGLLIHAFFELVKHRNVVLFVIEGVIGVVVGIVVYNGQSFAQNIGVGGALI